MRSHFQYIRPQTLGDALEFLGTWGTETSILAGGTDLMIAIRSGNLTTKYVLDVSRLEELKTVETAHGSLFVGATLTYTEIINHATLRSLAPIIPLAASYVGSVQIRNVGTMGGNVANASPAADAVTALMVHNARVEICGPATKRIEPLGDIIVAPYQTTLKPGELITRFELEPLETSHYAFHRISRRRALSIARINLGAVANIDSNGLVNDLRLSVGSITPRPLRMTSAEDIFRDTVPNWSLIKESARIVSREMIRLSGRRASTEYKRPAVEGLVMKALSELFL